MNRDEIIRQKQNFEEIMFSKYAEHRCITEYRFTELTSPYDVAFISGSTNIIAESKCREDYDVNFFLHYGPFLELKKLKGMLTKQAKVKSRNVNSSLYYLNFASNGLMIYKLKDEKDYVWQQQLLPKDNIDPHIKVWKTVTKLFKPEEIIKAWNKTILT